MTGPSLEDIEAAAERIKGHIRRTPFLRARFLKDNPSEADVLLKLESLQVTGSFKPRGALNTILSMPESERNSGVVTASGGNHGLGVTYAARATGVPVVVYVPKSTPKAKTEKIAAWGAQVFVEGDVWDEAEEAALAHGKRDGLTYIHPFSDPRVIAGQGTLALEMLKQSGDCDVFVIAIGGGGLISGIASAIKAKKPDARIYGVEAEGAPTLTESLNAGKPVTLPRITTAAGTLAPKRSAQINFDIIREKVESIVLVSDPEMRDAARWLWFEMGIAAELAGAAGLAALRSGRLPLSRGEKVGVLVCGAGSDGID
ncbi:MAG: threonine/serine dehydratase [Kiloniellales bacterium]|nr:threonine/serine dehydratase [Kiloniellales bacterium]